MSSASSPPSTTTSAAAPPLSATATQTARNFLKRANETGILGSGPREHSVADTHPFLLPFSLIFRTLPIALLLYQTVWSTAVCAAGWALGRERGAVDTFTPAFWQSRLAVSTTVSYAVGWALFALLGFFISEASSRYREAQIALARTGTILNHLARHVRQNYPPGTWHDSDLDRLLAHLVAYPIALKMALRGERDAEQLSPLLHADDVADVVAADIMHIHCSRVVRAYISAAEDDALYSFGHTRASCTPAGWGVRYLVIDLIDNIDKAATVAMRIAEFKPSLGYVNHMHVFLYIWLTFLPLAILPACGWFTILWSLLISYGIGMLFSIARALNEPFGFDVQDIKLNRVCSKMAMGTLDYGFIFNILPHDIVRAKVDTPDWLHKTPPKRASLVDPPAKKKRSLLQIITSVSTKLDVIAGMAAFLVWCTFIILLTYNLREPVPEGDDPARWWFIYVPLDDTTVTFVSLGIFLVLGFWINDAYGRYRRGLYLWQTVLRTNIEEVAFQICMACPDGIWHPGDRDRIISHLAAVPYILKQVLRGSKDMSELSTRLSAADVRALEEAPNPDAHVFDVLYAYLSAADAAHSSDTVEMTSSPFGSTKYTLLYTIWDLEFALGGCKVLNVFPLSFSYTVHLRLFTVFWLSLLPLTLVIKHGFTSYIYLVPIGYSIINLLHIGNAMADPFGMDHHDIPIDILSDEIRDSVHHTYHDLVPGATAFIHNSPYDREDFLPEAVEVRPAHMRPAQQDITPTILGSLKSLRTYFPSVSLLALAATILWNVIAVVASNRLSRAWDREDLECRAWCSPLDVSGTVLGNVGFALFMLLAFRASDALGRYDDGALLIFEMQMHLRNCAIEVVQSFNHGGFHENDLERIVAHIVQVPLCFRDMLLGYTREKDEDKEGLLSEDDYKRFESADTPIEHLLQTVESYFLLQDTDAGREHMNRSFNLPGTWSYLLIHRISLVRATIAQAVGVKRFPVIGSYTNHQYIFTGLWLALLPLSMTSETGWYSILWASLIGYGVLGMEAIASQLVDPYGHDAIDIPVDDLCRSSASSILEGVHSVGWNCNHHVHATSAPSEPGIGVMIDGPTVGRHHTLAYFEEHEATQENFGKGDAVKFSSPREAKMKPSLYAHLLRSVPWWILAALTIWTFVACVISYVTRERGIEGVRWWKTAIYISPNVATYVSFATFALLGFFVSSAFRRYNDSGSVWGDNLRASCHSIASGFLSLAAPGGFHEGDHERIIGHVAAVPLMLKQELRGSRDVRELKGLLSTSDVAAIQYADSMVSHCVDVLRSYLIMSSCHAEQVNIGELRKFGSRGGFIKAEVIALEKAIRSSKYLMSFPIAPGFVILLRTMLIIWFIVLPFVLAEISGWFTVLWVPLIGYGVLGTYCVAEELQNPFGTDLNDLDLDKIADSIVADVLFVQKHQKNGWKSLICDCPAPSTWTEPAKELDDDRLFEALDRRGLGVKILERLRLMSHAVSLWTMALVVAWSGAAVTAAYFVGQNFGSEAWREADNCAPWFCSQIAVSGYVQEYIGFGLFLLLATRLYDSHWRYVNALTLWQDGLIGTSHLLTNRLFESYESGTWHEGDLERICGHIAAFAICLMGSLRGENCEGRLREVLGEEDVRKVLSTVERVDYCLDVVRAYLIDGERLEGLEGFDHPCGSNELWAIMWYVARLQDSALACQRMIRIPLPFGYVQHLRIFLLIWMMLLPLSIVEASGWLSILWIVFIAYGLIGIEHWAAELCDPFGTDVCDVPLAALTERVVAVVKGNLDTFSSGMDQVIREDRAPFPSMKKGAGDDDSLVMICES